jgi:5-methylcytosine-specific restriction endonuclease McrA
MKKSYSKNNHCKCGKLISNYAIGCKKCAAKERTKISEKCSRYVDGRSLKKYYCECGKEITYPNKRCMICSKIGENNPFYGKHHTEETKKKLSELRIKSKLSDGDKNPNWHGGTENFPYPFEFNEELKEFIRNRDNYECQNCSMTEEEHLIVTGMVLHIHHIDYNKDNCNEDNLITLCNSCNSRANFNRDYWLNYYQIKLQKIGVL